MGAQGKTKTVNADFMHYCLKRVWMAEGASEDSPAEAATDEERAAKAEEIRRRVAERRAQLRAEAARRRGEQNEDKD